MAPIDEVDRLIDQTAGGILPLRPTYVRRFYPDGGRLGIGTRPGDTFNPKDGLWKPERWLVSCSTASNPHPIANEGLSLLAGIDSDLPLREVLQARGAVLLGKEYSREVDNEFRVLTKLLDGNEPIVVHFHATDEQVKSRPQNFAGHRYGKDEAYHFLEAPKGPVPYTHFGFYPDLTVEQIRRAIDRGRDYLLEAMPHYYQTFGHGYFTPAAVPHRPGTAFTLEIQEPSDVYTLLEHYSGGAELSPEQMHPGFATLEEAFELIDFETALRPDLLESYRIVPETIRSSKEGREEWVFPPRFTHKFSGKKITVAPGRTFETSDAGSCGLFVWHGEGRLNDTRLAAGSADEFFLGVAVAALPHQFENTGDVPLEVFKFFPWGVYSAGS